jgi:hypothetical protein
MEVDEPTCDLKMLRLDLFFERRDSRKEGRDGVGGISLSMVVAVLVVLLPDMEVSPDDKLGRGGV